MKRFLLVFAIVAGCTDAVDHVTPPTGGGDGGGGGGDGGTVTDAAPGTKVTQIGQVIELGTTSTGVASAKLDFGNGNVVTADAKGKYSASLVAGDPFSMRISADAHTTVLEQEWKLSGDFDRKTTSLPDTATTQTLLGALSNLDKSKGVLSVGLVITGGCPDEGGATIALDPPGTTEVSYFQNGLPSKSLKQSIAGQTTPTAIIYNVDPGNTFTIKVTHPVCTAMPFPVTPSDMPTLTYTGKVPVEPAWPDQSVPPKTSFIRIYITK